MTTASIIHKFGLCASIAGVIAFSTACGGKSTNTDSGPADAGNNNTTDAGNNNTDAGSTPTTYCDGFSAKDSSSNNIYVGTFAFGSTLKTEGCLTTLEADPNGTSLTTLSGVFDIDTSDNGTGSPVAAIFPGDCDDVGQTGYTNPASAPAAPTDGSITVAAAYATSPATGIYGVVTAINAWAYNSATDQDSGELYIQDVTTSGTPAAVKSGTEIYFPKPTSMTTYGTAPAVGDYIEVKGITWSPYEGVNQYEAKAGTTTVTVLGQAPLPTPVMLPATTISSSGITTSGYEGMRVQLTGGPFTITGSEASLSTCPTELQYTASSGG